MIGYLARHTICCDWTYDWVSLLVMFNCVLNYFSTQLVSLLWLDLSIAWPMTWYNWFQPWIGSIDSDSLFLIPLKYSNSDVLPFTFHVEGIETRSQSYSREYGWLGLDLTRNTQGRYILIFLDVLINTTRIVCTAPLGSLLRKDSSGIPYILVISCPNQQSYVCLCHQKTEKEKKVITKECRLYQRNSWSTYVFPT